MNLKKEIVNFIPKFPNWINEYLIKFNNNPNYVYGAKYREYLSFIEKNSEHYDNTEDLIKLVNYAIKNVPYYNKYSAIKSKKDFQTNFGFIDRNVVSDNFHELQSHQIDFKKYDLVTTGGTTGSPLRLLLPKLRYIIEKATLHSMWSRVGFNHDTRAVLRNHRLPDNSIYKLNPITKEYIFDGFRLNEDYLHEVYRTIKRKNIRYVHAYPSNAFELSKFIKNNNLDSSIIKAFISSSENVFDYQKDFITKTLGINFFNFYGHTEKIIIGGYCRHNDNYHIEPTYGFFELIDTEGNIIDTPGEVGEIVGTTLNNFGMPLIRYKTDDFAEYAGNYCDKCKRYLPVLKKIEGRKSGRNIFDLMGNITTPTGLNFHNELFLVIDGLQYIQNLKGVLEVKIVKGEKFKDLHDKKIKQHYKSKFSDRMEIKIRYVDKVQKQPNGKFLDLISKL
jgi:phenylacetate-CoA ligase